MRRIDETLLDIPVRPHGEANTEIPPDEPVAVMLVNGFTGMGIHTVLSVQNLFPHQFKNYLFLSVGVIDSENFKGVAEIDALQPSDGDRPHQVRGVCPTSSVFAPSIATTSEPRRSKPS